MLYTYTAKDIQGELHEGSLDVADKFMLARELRKKDLTLIKSQTSEAHAGDGLWSRLRTLQFNHVPYKEKIRFFDSLATMLNSGLTLSRALSVLARQTKNQKMRKHISTFIEEISHGASFASTLEKEEKLFSKEAIELVRAGEASGSLPESLKRIAETMHRRYDVITKIRGAMIYPSIVVVVMLAIGFFMLTVVVPPLTETFEAFEVELPLLTRILISAGTFVRANMVLTLSALVIAILAIVEFFRTTPGRRLVHSVLLATPGLRIPAREYFAGASLRTFSALLSAGIDIIEALEITQEATTNERYRKALGEAIKRVKRGAAVHTVFLEQEDLYPAFVSEMAEVGDETGKLAKMLDGVAQVYEDHIEQLTKNLSAVVEPALMIIVGFFVALFAIAVIDPLYSLTNSLS